MTKKYFYAIGRRKGARAIARLYLGKGEITVNGKPIADYFPGVVNKQIYEKPFVLTDSLGKFHLTINVVGGGVQGQLEAMILSIARAFQKINRDKYRPSLKKAGLLTVDSRVRERRKVGQMGRARKKKQSPKR